MSYELQKRVAIDKFNLEKYLYFRVTKYYLLVMSNLHPVLVLILLTLSPNIVIADLFGVRRQTLWNHLTLFLSDTFLPVTYPV